MKALKCEMCGSNDVVKIEGLYICQNCGTKYTVEEARKMMIEGTVDVRGTIKIDTSQELKNLYELARRAKYTNNSENALKYYDMIIVKDPSSWEANFYSVYYKACSYGNNDVERAASSISNCLLSVFELVRDNVAESKQQQVIDELYIKSSEISDLFFKVAKAQFESVDVKKRGNYTVEYYNRVFAAKQILYDFGDYLKSVFDQSFSNNYVNAWKEGVRLHYACLDWRWLSFGNKQVTSQNRGIITRYADKIKEYDHYYKSPVSSKNKSFHVSRKTIIMLLLLIISLFLPY